MISNKIATLVVVSTALLVVTAHGPPKGNIEDVSMGRKMNPKWCGMSKKCTHDRMPICGISNAGDYIGFRDLCDMFDYNCIHKRNYRQANCPENKGILTFSRRPPTTTSNYYDD